jgi:hypothetical protein
MAGAGLSRSSPSHKGEKEMRKIGLIAIAVMACGYSALAGFDMFQNKHYTTIMSPTVMTPAQVITNAANTGVDCTGLQGIGALVIAYDCNDLAADTLAVVIQSCATTNGNYATVTNGNGAALSYTFTSATGFYVTNVVPNAQSRYWRAMVTAGATTTNASCGVVLVTE